LELLWLGIVAALALLVYIVALMALKEIPRNVFAAVKSK